MSKDNANNKTKQTRKTIEATPKALYSKALIVKVKKQDANEKSKAESGFICQL